MELYLRGANVLITGGTRGIGKAIADAFVEEGANISVCGRSDTDVFNLIADAESRGVRATGRAIDVGDTEALTDWIEETARYFGGIDVVVANVTAHADGDTEKAWHDSYAVDLMSMVQMIAKATPHLVKSRAPAIVSIASVSGSEIDDAAGAYGATKAALIHYTQTLARSLAPKGIRANTVSPGNIYFEGGVWHRIEKQSSVAFHKALAENPTGRFGRPEEVARAVLFLASSVSSFTSGANLLVDGALSRAVRY